MYRVLWGLVVKGTTGPVSSSLIANPKSLPDPAIFDKEIIPSLKRTQKSKSDLMPSACF